MEPFTIRKALPADAPEISALIRRSAHYFTINPNGEGAEQFLLTITPEAITGHISNPRFLYLAGSVGVHLAGVAAIRDGKHLFHFFVSGDFQRQGIGHAMWQRTKSEAESAGNNEGFTVNSTPYAVPFYESLGFRATGPKVEKNGIAFVPMRY